MENIKLNKHGVNDKIKGHILEKEKMNAAGFVDVYYPGTKYEQDAPYWYFRKAIKFPEEKRYKNFCIEFSVQIPKDGSDISIDVLDMDFCQPYDYQYMLHNNPTFKPALIVNEQVEEWMEQLQMQGILSGHVKGEYI